MHAEDMMTQPLLSIRRDACWRDACWREALQLLLSNACNAAPVVDEERHLVGIITQTDLAARTTASERFELYGVFGGVLCVRSPHTFPHWHPAPHREGTSTVGMLMTTPVVTAYAETPVAEVARRLLDHGVAQVPIVDRDGVLQGMVARRDVVAARSDGVNLVPPMEEAFAAWARA